MAISWYERRDAAEEITMMGTGSPQPPPGVEPFRLLAEQGVLDGRAAFVDARSVA